MMRTPLINFTFSLLSILSLLSFTIGSPVRAQGVNSGGTDYWVGFMPNFNGGNNVTQLYLASGTNNTVKVTVGGATTTYTLNPNQGITADLSGQGVTTIPETPSSSSVHVTSTAPLTMYGYNVWNGGGGFIGGSPDGYLALPTAALGTSYYTVNYYDASFSGTPTVGEFVIIAPNDSTRVTIKTSAHTQSASGLISHNPGDTWSFLLMKGESYLVQSSGQYIGVDDLTGSSVTSSKPVALLSGHQIAPIDYTMMSADHLLEMVPPVDKWGTQYFDMPMAGRTKCGDLIRILSAENGNQIMINGKNTITLDAGKWQELHEVTTPEVYTSINHKKFIVAQYSYSLGFDGDPSTNADPFLILFTPQENFEKRMIFRTPLAANGGSFINYLTVIAPRDSINAILINGQRIAIAYKTIGVSDFPGTTPQMSALRIELPNGSNTYSAVSNVPFGAYQYGFGNYEGYGWPTGEALNVHSPDTLPPLQTQVSHCGSYNVHLMEDRSIPTFSFDDTHIAEVDFITEQNDPRWKTPSYNYTFSLDSSFNPGDSTANFSLKVIDASKDAYAAIYTVDRAGNDTVYTYSYSPLLAPTVTVHGDTLRSSAVANNQWYKDGRLLPGDTNQILVTASTGDYVDYVHNTAGCIASSPIIPFGEGASVDRSTAKAIDLRITPNPYTDVTYLDYELAARSLVEIEVLNLLGESVLKLESGSQDAGHFHLPITLNQMSTQGTYFVRASINGIVTTKKMVMLR